MIFHLNTLKISIAQRKEICIAVSGSTESNKFVKYKYWEELE